MCQRGSEYARPGAGTSIGPEVATFLLLLAEEVDEALGDLGRDVFGLKRASHVDGAAVRVHERHAGGTEVEVNLERPCAFGWELAFEVVYEELHALVAARHVGDEFHARSLSSAGPGDRSVPGPPDRSTGPRGKPLQGEGTDRRPHFLRRPAPANGCRPRAPRGA